MEWRSAGAKAWEWAIEARIDNGAAQSSIRRALDLPFPSRLPASRAEQDMKVTESELCHGLTPYSLHPLHHKRIPYKVATEKRPWLT
jgi:hypothetical protein